MEYFNVSWVEGHPGRLWSERILYPLDFSNTIRVLNQSYAYYRDHAVPMEGDFFWYAYDQLKHFVLPGRLACTLTGAGKRRIFAIGNYVRQRLLHPVHSWAMRVLSRIVCDGTFQQERPIHRLRAKGYMDLCSYDLSSATDRWPATIIYTVMSLIWGKLAAECFVQGTLASPQFKIGPPFVKGEALVVFGTGQPLGYYGSWALFSLSHHYVVWLAAHMVNPRRRSPFRQYALLGDDIVIADRDVSEAYLELISRLGVSISKSKSLDSKIGALEFAKQFWVKGVQVNLTPVSAKALMSIHTFLGLCHVAEKYDLSQSVLIRLAGAGFRVRARCRSTKLSLRWKRLMVLSDKKVDRSHLPLDLWLGRGNPLNPYLKGLLVEMVLRKAKPTELCLVPDEYLGHPSELDILERTLYYKWLKEWLEWLRWYCLMTMGPDPSMEDLLSPPICSTSWKRSLSKDKVRVRFGLIWECWDLAEGWDLSRVPPCLCAGREAVNEIDTSSNSGISDVS